MSEELIDQPLGPHTTALLGAGGGRYPDANALLVEGSERRLLIDPTLGVLERIDRLPPIDLVVLSHCHEDHLPALPNFASAECWVHQADLPGLLSLDGFLDLFGMPEPRRSHWQQVVLERFRYQPRPDARPYQDGHLWDLGGVTVRARHAPGHTRGHSVLAIEPDDVLFLGDIDLSSFGPYYGDAWSDLEEFEASLERARSWSARHYVTGHHIAVLDDRGYRERLERYIAKIADREQRLLEFLAEPHTLDDIAAHRFVYRPHDDVPNAGPIERRSMGLHLERLIRDGRVKALDDGRFAVTG